MFDAEPSSLSVMKTVLAGTVDTLTTVVVSITVVISRGEILDKTAVDFVSGYIVLL